ncbi:MAG: biopolymer transporter ExbD [Acidobacteria bacterium]|jgi:biopolymer transport protein ExbD|nr:biopolymer transporter ExbD [Acidobacteriota bacterium]
MRLSKLGRRGKPEVPIAPLIDVVFLLLIFYSVTTQFVSDQRLKLKLPEAKTAESAGVSRERRPPVVTVAVDGTVWIDQKLVPKTQLEGEMKRLVQRTPDKTIILKGDRGANYGIVIHVLDVARSVGAKTIQMSAVKPEK